MQIEVEHAPDKGYIKIPVVKATTKQEASWVEVCVDDLPADVYKEVLLQGLKTLLNRGMTGDGFTGTKDEKMVVAAMAKAKDNLENLYAGKIRMSAGVRSKISGAVKTEAMRLARILIKDELKRAGEKVSHYAAKDITAAAKALLEGEQGASILKAAETSMKEREEKEKGLKISLEGLQPDAKMVKAAEEKKAKAKKPVPAGVMAKAKPAQAQHQHH